MDFVNVLIACDTSSVQDFFIFIYQIRDTIVFIPNGYTVAPFPNGFIIVELLSEYASFSFNYDHTYEVK